MIAGPAVTVIDSAEQSAQDVMARLKTRHLLRSEGAGSLRCIVTDDAPRFARLASRFLGYSIAEPVCVRTDDLPPAELQAVRMAG
jgi:glutamate racemase